MAHRSTGLLLAIVLAAPLAVGCVVGTRSGGRPAHAGPPQRVPPGQIRRAEVHQRNEARKADHHHGHGHGHD